MNKYEFDPITRESLEKLPTPLAVYQFIDKKVVTLLVSDGFLSLFGYDDRTEVIRIMDHDMYCDSHPDDVERISNEAYRFATEGGKYEAIYRTLVRNEPEYKIVHALGEHIFTDDGTRLAYVWYTEEGLYTYDDNSGSTCIDSSLSAALHSDSVAKASHFDYLTGLPSMTFFFELAEIHRNELLKADREAAVLFIDLGGMKYYNRKYGFQEGDKLLRDFSEILKDSFNAECCSRFGSDHFCVITDDEDIENKLNDVFSRFKSLGRSKSMPIHAGIYIDSAATLDISTDCDRAKYACDTLKNSYYSGFAYFKDSILQKADDRRYIINHLDEALANGWIKVMYQPIVRCANGKVSNEEALSRWIDPKKGPISPAVYIPILEDAGQIYKLDLYIVEQMLEKMKKQRDAGLHVVSESVNLSRVDFDSCDIVEEIRRRVDDSGIGRDMLNIEITESTLANDFDYMKSQIERFRELGFSVWMDDFGNGYSSMDVLQRVDFDLIKLDMRFLKEFDHNEKCKVILTQLIRMAIALGIETICEGVETKEQVDFLKEVGCTKLQGFYYCTPVNLEEIIERNRKGRQIGFEDPAEADYYSAISKVDLYDLNIFANEDKSAFEDYFNTLPMAVIETDDDSFTLVRCNSSYRAFMEKMFGYISLGSKVNFSDTEDRSGSGFMRALHDCGKNGDKMVLDESMADGSVIHAFIKRVAINPVTGIKALAVAVLDVLSGSNNSMSYTQIAKALLPDHIRLYNVDLDTNSYIEYKSDYPQGTMSAERHGEDFFGAGLEEAQKMIFHSDLSAFRISFTKENIMRSVYENGVYTIKYRVISDGEPIPVRLNAAIVSENGGPKLIIGVTNDRSYADRDAEQRKSDKEAL